MANNKETIIPWGCVFKITYPNQKIYVGSDTAKEAKADFFKYFGTPVKAKNDMLNDMAQFLSGNESYVVKKDILFSSQNVKIGEVLRVEQEFIKSLNAKDPNIGYNR
tara:strand:+ start:729 stop:1049 length:321 start_codon:yes stop_codon:yes gene_type:complete